MMGKEAVKAYVVECDTCGRTDLVTEDKPLPYGWYEGSVTHQGYTGEWVACGSRCLRNAVVTKSVRPIRSAVVVGDEDEGDDTDRPWADAADVLDAEFEAEAAKV